ncbi:hypothetical protein DM01DRAFT_1381829 [Hesseltinella vesiculosa]|uniref:BZIP domain-containing protein n=1 Tax=Hesseltinella vesiculosa TaxID=101127 RepID=A0A1X2GPD2_9FUNG|nr:hypothetical protein DM01DRAFT_1381829 [Hesseltinella vesiculosa]
MNPHYDLVPDDDSLLHKRKHDATIDLRVLPNQDPDNGHLPDDEEVKVKRKTQNRLAQRAFRERKERYVKQLEVKIQETNRQHAQQMTRLMEEKQQLVSLVFRLQAEIQLVKTMTAPMDPTLYDPSLPSLPLHTSYSLPLTPPAIEHMSLPLALPSTPSASASLQPTAPTLQPKDSALKPLAAKKPLIPLLPQHPSPKSSTSHSPAAQRPPQKSQKPLRSTTKKDQTSPPRESQSFTFSITTPESLKKAKTSKPEPIQLVSLYTPSQVSSASAQPIPISNLSSTETRVCQPPSEDDPFALNDRSLLDCTSPSQSIPTPAPANHLYRTGTNLDTTPTPLPLSSAILDENASYSAKSPSLSSSKTAAIAKSLKKSTNPDDLDAFIHPADLSTFANTTLAPHNKHEAHAPVWQKLTEHANNNKFSVDHFVEAISKTSSSIRENKQLVDDWDLRSMIQDMDYYL